VIVVGEFVKESPVLGKVETSHKWIGWVEVCDCCWRVRERKPSLRQGWDKSYMNAYEWIYMNIYIWMNTKLRQVIHEYICKFVRHSHLEFVTACCLIHNTKLRQVIHEYICMNTCKWIHVNAYISMNTQTNLQTKGSPSNEEPPLRASNGPAIRGIGGLRLVFSSKL